MIPSGLKCDWFRKRIGHIVRRISPVNRHLGPLTAHKRSQGSKQFMVVKIDSAAARLLAGDVRFVGVVWIRRIIDSIRLQ